MLVLGSRIARAREDADPWMSQDDLAKAIGVTTRTVAYWEAGRVPKADVLARIADVTGKPINFFYEEAA